MPSLAGCTWRAAAARTAGSSVEKTPSICTQGSRPCELTGVQNQCLQYGRRRCRARSAHPFLTSVFPHSALRFSPSAPFADSVRGPARPARGSFPHRHPQRSGGFAQRRRRTSHYFPNSRPPQRRRAAPARPPRRPSPEPPRQKSTDFTKTRNPPPAPSRTPCAATRNSHSPRPSIFPVSPPASRGQRPR